MGVFLNEDTFVSEWNTDKNVMFKLNPLRRNFQLEFWIAGRNDKTYYKFRLESYFNDVEGEFLTELDTQGPESRAITTIRTKYPPKLFLLDENLEWTRKTALQAEKPSDEETGHPIMPSYSNATGKELGRWYAYRVTFNLDRSGGFKRLKDMLSNAASNNIAPKESMFSNAIPVVDGSTLPTVFYTIIISMPNSCNYLQIKRKRRLSASCINSISLNREFMIHFLA